MPDQLSIQALPGFRELFPEDFARLRVITDAWRETARRYGFVEYDAPTLEPAALYEKKNSGGEILEQLYRFVDRGERDVCLRPEMTPSLARMVSARSNRYRKPLKWFSIARFFRYERQQKGRLREFLQWNCDIFGDESAGADAEVVALTVDCLRALGLGVDDFVVRLSDRRVWRQFFEQHGIADEQAPAFLALVDRIERTQPEDTEQKLAKFGVGLAELRHFLGGDGGPTLRALLDDLDARGLAGFVEPDLAIVRGLAYYTGLVFEVFDRRRALRAVAGGGRYDRLIESLSDGAAALPAVGMGMGDVVLARLIESVPAAAGRMEQAVAADSACQVYVVVADESRRGDALGVAARLREAGRRTDFALAPAKVGRQFQAAEAVGAAYAVLVGAEWPQLKIKQLTTRTEIEIHKDALAHWAQTAQF